MSNRPSESVLMATAATRNNSPAAEIKMFPQLFQYHFENTKEIKRDKLKTFNQAKNVIMSVLSVLFVTQ